MPRYGARPCGGHSKGARMKMQKLLVGKLDRGVVRGTHALTCAPACRLSRANPRRGAAPPPEQLK
eukprot:gene13819-55220_t